MAANNYQVHGHMNCIEGYQYPDNIGNWLLCPRCGLSPKTWVFDNGRSTACGCWNDDYDHFSIHAESIGSLLYRTGGDATEYDLDGLRKNWNRYCATGEIAFGDGSKHNNGEW